MRSRSIRYYYFTSITTVLIAGIMLMGMIQTLLSVSYFRGEKERPLQRLVSGIAVAVRSGHIQLEDSSMQLVGYMAEISGATVLLTDAAGVVVYRTGPMAPAVGSQLPEYALETLNVPNGLYSEYGTLGGLYLENHYTYGVPLYGTSGGFLGNLFVSADASGMSAYISDTMSTFVLSAALVLLVSSILALILSNRTVIPLRRVNRAAQRFAEGDYSARVPVEGGDELAQLAVAFNEMASSFQATDISRRNFMGNIAHELRTPMTTIKGFIDGMLDGTIPPEQQEKYLRIVSDEVGRLSRLVRNMLDVSKLEAGEYVPSNTVFDIWKPIVSVVLGAEQRLEEKSLSVEGMEDTTPIQVLADEDFTHQVLFNLVDNAIKFAVNSGTVSLAVTTDRTMVTVCVQNSGEGIPADTLPHIFDRFYKADKSRGLNARGAGLGLHISKVLTGLMGGRIWAESEQGAWARFCFTLPLAEAGRRGPAWPRRGAAGQNPPPEAP